MELGLGLGAVVAKEKQEKKRLAAAAAKKANAWKEEDWGKQFSKAEWQQVQYVALFALYCSTSHFPPPFCLSFPLFCPSFYSPSPKSLCVDLSTKICVSPCKIFIQL